MSDVVAKCDNEKITKVKVASAEIIVSGKADKPYYEIKYYDLSKNEWCIGYSSYELKFVFQWLNECFEFAKNPQQCNSDLISRKKLIEDLTNPKYSFDINTPKSHEKTIREMASKQYESVLKCINSQPQVQPIVRTQADRIRNMSDEELLSAIINTSGCITCEKLTDGCGLKNNVSCKEWIKNWLQSEVKEV